MRKDFRPTKARLVPLLSAAPTVLEPWAACMCRNIPLDSGLLRDEDGLAPQCILRYLVRWGHKTTSKLRSLDGSMTRSDESLRKHVWGGRDRWRDSHKVGEGISPSLVPLRPFELSVKQTHAACTRSLVSGGLLTTSAIPMSQGGNRGTEKQTHQVLENQDLNQEYQAPEPSP